MKSTVILSGKLTAKGNLSGYDVQGERVHIPALQLESAGIDPTKIPYPFFALVTTKQIQRRDPAFPDATGNDHLLFNDDKTPAMVERLQSGSIFLTEKEMNAASNSSDLIKLRAATELRLASLEAAIELNKVITASGMTTDSVTSLLESSLFS